MNRHSITIFSIFCITALLTISCQGGSGGDSSTKQKPPDQGGNTDSVYLTVSAVNHFDVEGNFSNEVVRTISNIEKSNVTIAFDEPNEHKDGSCLTNQISHYIVYYGPATGSYSNQISIDRDSPQLVCTTTGVHPSCGNITNCVTTIPL